MAGKKILIADYIEENLHSLAKLLQAKGYQIVMAQDGISGLEKFEAEKPELVITEAFLPEVSGFELCKKIASEYDEEIPVIIITGVYHGIKYKDEVCRVYGAAAYIEKPYKEEELFSIIHNLVGKAKEEEIKKEKIDSALVSEESPEEKIKEDQMKMTPRVIEEEEIKTEFKDDTDTKLKISIGDTGIEMEEIPDQTKVKKILEKEEKKLEEEEKKKEREEKFLVRIGDYVLLEKVASGGMGTVFKARKIGVEGFEKIFAMKRIHPHLIEDNKEFIEMFIDEAKLAAQLTHPNVVQIYDLGKKDQYYYIVMEHVFGKDLDTILKRLRSENKAMPFHYLAFIGINLCQALDYAHRKYDSSGKSLGIVHRDVSPKNILISFEGEVKLTDFGVAKAASKIHQTMTGSIKGKIPYMSPQQASGDEIDHRSDIFSLGTVLFEMAVGEKLFSAESEMALLRKVQNAQFVPPSKKNPDIPKDLENIILRVLQLDPQRRYQTAIQLKKDLERFLRDYKESIPAYSDIAQFMVRLFSDEIEERSLIKTLEETKSVTEKEEKVTAEKILEPAYFPDTAKDTLAKKMLYKLMLADDNAETQKLVNSALRREDLKIISFSDGQKVLDSIEQINPDIVLLNLTLPKKDGYEVCKFIKNNKKLTNTTVIFLKEASEKIDDSKIKKLSYYDILRKPFNPRKLAQKVNKIIENIEHTKLLSDH